METIQGINLPRFRQVDLAGYCIVVDEKLQETSIIFQQAPVQARAFHDLVGRFSDKVKLSRKKVHTEELKVADAKRDRGYSGYRSGLAFFKHATGAEHEAYEKLSDHLNLYNFTSRIGRVQETDQMLQFIPDLRDKAGLGKEVALLNLTSFVDMMEEGNNEVMALEKEANVEASQVVLGETQALAKELIEAYHDLINAVNVLMRLKGEEKYADFRDYVNAVMMEYKRKVLKQKVSPPTGEGPGDGSGGGDNSGGEEEPPQG
ncbi:MAG: DUF6261 family protein [Prevotellaceae bacterium]|jgi:hypothetical protein|nr:DUF6261 family protein [Prevotellaceae bacterium]